jgi:hypothetical protein
VAFAGDGDGEGGGPSDEQRGARTPSPAAATPEDGPFAVAEATAARDQASANADRHHAAREAFAAQDRGRYRTIRVRLMSAVAQRLGVDRQTMWQALRAVRRQTSPRAWADARDEALTVLAWELDRPVDEVERAVRAEVRRRFGHDGRP